MRIMDSSMQNDDCSIEAVTPAKKKKMKQARLPFQMLSSVESPNSITNKKRKLSSPSVEYKSPKVLKITSKENSLDDLDEEKAESVNNSMADSDGSVEIIEAEKADDERDKSDTGRAERKTTTTPKRRSKGRQSKTEDDQKKSSALMKFLGKTDQDAEAAEEAPNTPNRKDKDVKRNEEAPNTPNRKDKDVKRNEEPASTPKTPKNTKNRKKYAASPEANSSLNSEEETPTQSSEEDEDKRSECNESNMDDSMVNDSPKTPRTPSARTSNADKAGNDAKQKKLTPKQQQRQLQVVKRKEEKQRLRMEKEKKLEEERENRRKEKEEKRKEKEEKRKVKEERERAEKQQKLKEKQLRDMKKQQELEQKQKEKDAKEEERRKREEEKRKKEEEKLEAERKKQKAASNFASFFVAKKQEAKSAEEETVVELRNFMPFEVKADMKMAPLARRILTEEEKSSLDAEMRAAGHYGKSDLYINEIKTRRIVPRKSGETWPVGAKDDVILIDDENDGSSTIVDRQDTAEKHRPKLLQFRENRRPPYWGTWRKRSDTVKPRRPFATDSKWFNYEVDSDDEWEEEEEEGESLRGSDEEKDEENAEDNEYDIDNEFMVPHGYLSDEEVQMEEKENEFMSPESRKLKLKVLGEQFESQRNAKTWQLKPKIVGCVWQGPGNKFPENVVSKTVEFLMARQIWTNEIPVVLPAPPANNETVNDSQASVSKKTKVPEEALPDLIRLVHCNTHGRDFLVKEFMTHWNKRNKLGENQISKASLLQKIREIARRMACPDEGPMHLKACWYVPEETRKAVLPEGEELSVPNRWSYNLTPKRKSDVADLPEKPDREEKDRRNVAPLITQFIKKIPQDEAKRQSTGKPESFSVFSKGGNQVQRPPKRATLISVGRGQQFPQETRRSLVTTVGKEKSEQPNDRPDSDDDVVLIDDHLVDKANESKGNDDRLETVVSKDFKNSKDIKDFKNSKDSKDFKDSKNSKDFKDFKDSKETTALDRDSSKTEVLDSNGGKSKSTNRSSDTPMEIDDLACGK